MLKKCIDASVRVKSQPQALLSTLSQCDNAVSVLSFLTSLIDASTASSFPFTTAGHTQATTYAHAEKLLVEIIQKCIDIKHDAVLLGLRAMNAVLEEELAITDTHVAFAEDFFSFNHRLLDQGARRFRRRSFTPAYT